MLGFRGLGLRGWGFFDMLWCQKSMALEVLAGADPLLGVSTKPVVLKSPAPVPRTPKKHPKPLQTPKLQLYVKSGTLNPKP